MKDAEMGHTEFESTVLEGISELRTHMKILVGEDGNGGKIKDLDSRLDVLEADKQRGAGKLIWLTGTVAAGIASGLTAVAQKVIGH